MKSTVLYHKQGTLAEPRFKNLTDLQWIYHYEEVKRFKRAESKDQVEMTKTLIAIFRDEMKMASYLIAPDNARKWEEQKKLDLARAEIPVENAQEFWDDLKTKIPTKIIAVNLDAGQKFVLPKKKISELGFRKKND